MSYVHIARLAAQYARARRTLGASNAEGATGITAVRASEARSFLLDRAIGV